ncbi:MAG: phosphoribosyltransferase [Alphaproteobacteria bacterium]|nr:phosphoribosyltransferase [Alphaproteobacteria bacterium]
MTSHSQFKNRHDAGKKLAKALKRFAGDSPLILALPRGGVPVAYEVAVELVAEMDLLLVRKIGAPGHEELGIGAIVDGVHPQVVLNEGIVRQLGPSPAYIQSETRKQLAIIAQRRRLYRGSTPPVDMRGRTVIVVDDGIATGGTARAALRGIKQNHPARTILAVPVAPADCVEQLERECDEVICLVSPSPFYAVGAYYADFTQTGDEEVIHLVHEIERLERPSPLQ